MFIQLHAVIKDQPDRPLLVNVHAIAYVEADTAEEWATVYFNGVAATYGHQSDEVYYNTVHVREDFATISARILATTQKGNA